MLSPRGPPPPSQPPGAYLQRGPMEDNALSEPHALAHGHPLPDGDIGAQLWRGTDPISPGGLGETRIQPLLEQIRGKGPA